MKRKYAKIAIAFAVAAATATTPVVSVLASEEAVVTSGEAIDGAMVTSGEEKPTSDAVATLKVNFTDEFGNTLGIEPVVATKTGPEGETAEKLQFSNMEKTGRFRKAILLQVLMMNPMPNRI